MRRPSQTCLGSDTPCKFTFLQGLSPHPAWALMLMGLPSLYSTGSDTLRHKWVPFSPAWALTLRRADHGPPLMLSLPNSFWTKIFKTKGGMEGKGKGKNPLLYFEHEGKAYSCCHSPNLKEEAAFFNLSDI